MFWRSVKGFTLLEVMLAVGVMALAGITIYRFVVNTVSTVQICRGEGEERTRASALMKFVRSQLLRLPEGCEGAVSGEAHRFDGVACDELHWISGPGSGVLTRYATGEWVVTLTTRRLDGNDYELGLRRRSVDNLREGDWLPLLGGVRGFEVRFFDPWRKEWMEKWVTPGTRPSLVRVKLWRARFPEPMEVIFTVPPMARPPGLQRLGGVFLFQRIQVPSC